MFSRAEPRGSRSRQELPQPLPQSPSPTGLPTGSPADGTSPARLHPEARRRARPDARSEARSPGERRGGSRNEDGSAGGPAEAGTASRHARSAASPGVRIPGLQPASARACDPAFQHGVVVGFDGSLSSERALAYAVGMARRSNCGLVIVHVANRLPATVWAGCEPPVFVDQPDHRTEVLALELACADFLAGVPWILVERGGDICHEIEEVGREYAADAIVVGSTHGLLGRVFGSVSGRLARRANRPVIVIP